MPTKDQLAVEANGLAAELDLAVTTDDLSHDKLVELVRDLKAKKTDAETVTQVDEATEAATAKAKARKAGKLPEPKRPPYYMAPRKAITAKTGKILSGDTADEVTAELLHGGEAALKAFVESGHILKD